MKAMFPKIDELDANSLAEQLAANPGLADHLEAFEKLKEERKENARRGGADAGVEYILTLRSRERAQAVIEAFHDSWPLPVRRQMLIECWGHDHARLVAQCGYDKILDMFVEARCDVSALPSQVTLFRGGWISSGGLMDVADGISWSLDPSCAAFFACRPRAGFNEWQPEIINSFAVVIVEVARDDALAYFAGGKEKEVIYDGSQLADLPRVYAGPGQPELEIVDLLLDWRPDNDLVAKWRELANSF